MGVSRLKKENGFITLNGECYSKLNWFEMYVFNYELRLLRIQQMLKDEKKPILLRMGKPKFN